MTTTLLNSYCHLIMAEVTEQERQFLNYCLSTRVRLFTCMAFAQLGACSLRAQLTVSTESSLLVFFLQKIISFDSTVRV